MPNDLPAARDDGTPCRLRWLGLAALLALAGCQTGGGREALWSIVNGQCVPREASGSPAPCLAVDTATGTALLKDRAGRSQVLLIPTTKVTGVEDPKVLTVGAGYFAAAWAATPIVSGLVGKTLPRQDLSLAINAPTARSQDQLHIHIDCVDLSVRAQMAQFGSAVGADWAPFPVPLAGQPYDAIRVASLAPPTDPFHLVADRLLPKIHGTMARATIVVIGSTEQGKPDFIVLAGQANLAHGDRGDGEALQDHDCSVAQQP